MTALAFLDSERVHLLPLGYVFVVRDDYCNAWGQHAVNGVLLDIENGTAQAGAHATGPDYATTREVLVGALQAAVRS